MGTKAQPGKHDCYEKAKPDEPMFILLARDPLSDILVELWAKLALLDGQDVGKIQEALRCANDMKLYRAQGEI